MSSVQKIWLLWTLSLTLILACMGCQNTGTGSTSTSGLTKNSPVPSSTSTQELINSTSAPTSTPELTPSTFPESTSTTEYQVPMTSDATEAVIEAPTPTPLAAPVFDQFVASVINGDPTQVVGVYVDGVMALQVVQQPSSNPSYVSPQRNVATYFTLVRKMTGNTGLLAHNYLAGVYYYELIPGQSVFLIYGDGSTEEFIVQQSEEYQALNPNNPGSNFIDLNSGETLTSTELFYRVYGGSDRTTFQTCVAQGNEDSWGRLFVISPSEQ